MIKVNEQAAQGDVMFRRVEDVPADARKTEAREHVVAHSETGHDHVAVCAQGEAGPPICHFATDDPLLSYLSCGGGGGGIVVEHRRTHDTHEALELGPGVWEVRRQREHVPGGWRQVVD